MQDKNKINYDAVFNLDKMPQIEESLELYRALIHYKYIYNNNLHGNNIAVAIEQKDTKVHIQSAVKFKIEFGKNLTSICISQLLEFCNKANWWFVINRCRHTRVEVVFRQNFWGQRK